MFTRTTTSPARERGLTVSRLWCASVKGAELRQGYSVPAELRLADSIKHESPISRFTNANQEMGT